MRALADRADRTMPWIPVWSSGQRLDQRPAVAVGRLRGTLHVACAWGRVITLYALSGREAATISSLPARTFVSDLALGTVRGIDVLLVADEEGTVSAFDLQADRPFGTPVRTGQTLDVMRLESVGGRPAVLAGPSDAAAALWDLRTGQRLATLPWPGTGALQRAVVSGDDLVTADLTTRTDAVQLTVGAQTRWIGLDGARFTAVAPGVLDGAPVAYAGDDAGTVLALAPAGSVGGAVPLSDPVRALETVDVGLLLVRTERTAVLLRHTGAADLDGPLRAGVLEFFPTSQSRPADGSDPGPARFTDQDFAAVKDIRRRLPQSAQRAETTAYFDFVLRLMSDWNSGKLGDLTILPAPSFLAAPHHDRHDTDDVATSVRLVQSLLGSVMNHARWRRAERVHRTVVSGETGTGLPGRPPGRNLLHGSPVDTTGRSRTFVRDPAVIAANLTGYFNRQPKPSADQP
jgi:hypothetical protein